jgi:lipopolysaccharide biosynthesis glycosyltransferase
LLHCGESDEIEFHIISNDLADFDFELLAATLEGLGRRYRLMRVRVDQKSFHGFPSMRGSLGPYFRLLMCALVDRPRSVYLDVDTLCLADVRELLDWDLQGHPAAFVAEGTIASTADASARNLMLDDQHRAYLNSGVMVADHGVWRERRVTEDCLDVLRASPVDRWDQTALNVVLNGGWARLDARFNVPTNRRAAWPDLARPGGASGSILHFLDYPKPWDFLAEWVHPHYRIWRETLDRTAMRSFRSWHGTPVRRFPRTAQAFRGYRQAAKDRLLFGALKRGWIAEVKGMNSLPSA